MMKNCLLVGNGLNQTLDKMQWGDLLKNLAVCYGVQRCQVEPLTLQFEQIMNQILCKADKPSVDLYRKVKTEIAEDMRKWHLQEDCLHYQLPKLGIDALITSNYDLLLEEAYAVSEDKLTVNAKKYISKPVWVREDGFQLYHSHGIVTRPATMCLGYEHYAGIIERMRSSFHSTGKESRHKAICEIMRGDRESTGSWAEHFYRSNIHIIGFGLDTSELDFWWLITHRAFLYYSNSDGMRGMIKNRIIYYDTVDVSSGKEREEERKRKEQKHKLLKDCLVEVKPYPLRNEHDYKRQYEAMLKDIKAYL